MNFTNLSGNFEYKPLIRVIDDDDAVRRSWAFLLSGESYDVVTYADAGSFLASSDFRRYGAILLDVRMPNMSGLELQNRLKELGCDLPIIFVSGHGDIDMAVNTLKNGAVDFLQKPVDPVTLNAVVEAAVQHAQTLAESKRKVEETKAIYASLTPREREVVRLAALDRSNKVIGEELGISLPTVKMHRGNGFQKLGVRGALEAFWLLESIGVVEKGGRSEG